MTTDNNVLCNTIKLKFLFITMRLECEENAFICFHVQTTILVINQLIFVTLTTDFISI